MVSLRRAGYSLALPCPVAFNPLIFPTMPVQRRIYAGEEMLVSMSGDRLLVALRLGDVAKVVRMEEGAELDNLVCSTGMEDEVWASPLAWDGSVNMISLEGARALMQAKGTEDAQCFVAWLDSQFPENAAVRTLSEDVLFPEKLHRIGELRQKAPDIQICEIAQRFSISEIEAQRYITYLELLHKLARPTQV